MARDAQAIFGAGAVDEVSEPGTVEMLSGDGMGEHADGAGPGQSVVLGGRVRRVGEDTSGSEGVARPGCRGRIDSDRLRVTPLVWQPLFPPRYT